MNQKEKVTLIIDILQLLYPDPPIPLHHLDEFTLLIAVLLSAQSTDKKVNEVTPQLFTKADTPNKIVRLSIEEIKTLIQQIGLYNSKAKNIHDLSVILLEQHQGKVPQTFEALEALPGVGHKTASVLMCQAFGQPAFPVDTHIHRLMHQWGLSSGKNVIQTEKDAKYSFPENLWNKLHLQIIYYGREYAPARGWKLEKDIIAQTIGVKGHFCSPLLPENFPCTSSRHHL
ncbi:MAG: endonuclease III [Flavobacteriales bacterium]